MREKKHLLYELSRNSYIMIKPSPIDGIGVFALQQIPKGCRDMFSKPDNKIEYIPLSKMEVENLPSHSKNLIETYCLFDADNYFVPVDGFKKMDLVNFINHSDAPNIISINDGDYFEAIKDIQPGEELLIDYGEIVEE
jgi:SET domain-containing protein